MIAGYFSLIILWCLFLMIQCVGLPSVIVMFPIDILSCAFMQILSVFLLQSISQAVSLKVDQTVFICILF